MKEKKKNARGITLIALVISIIVLLILAGVTIGSLTGENGILTRAKEAKQKTIKANELEKIQISVLSATIDKTGDIDTTTLRSELTKAGITIKTEGDNLPWEVTSENYAFTINEDLTIDEITGIIVSKKEVKLIEGQTEKITATLTEGINGKITWETSNANVATVVNGTITATGTSGEATITAKVEGTEYEAKCKVIIIQKVTEIIASDVTVGKKETAKIQVTTTPRGEVEELTYISETPSVATVSEDGTVTGITGGTTKITIRGKISTNVSTTCTVTVKKEKIKITAADIAANKEKYYGQVAQNYTQGGLTYRIFYVDTDNKFKDGKNTIYLKAEYKDKKSLITDINGLTEEDITKYKNMNPLWAGQKGTINKSNLNNNEKAAAWLCAPSQWTNYADSSIKGSYAIGGPSVEMYVKSYNDVTHSTGTAKNGLSIESSTKNVTGYIYKIDNTIQNNGWYTANNTIDNTGYNNMYAKSGTYWWLASPSAFGPNFLCCVNGYGANLNLSDNALGIGPLISIPSTFQIEVEQ